MSQVSYQTDEFIYFDNSEEKLIDKWLKSHGYTWGRATVCGNCCGFYKDEYWVNGINGKWKSQKDVDDFVKYAKQHNIACKLSGYDITAAEDGVTIDKDWLPTVKGSKK